LGVFRLRYGVHPEGVEEVTPERLAEIRQTVQGWHPFVSEEPDAPRLIATELLAEVERLESARDAATRHAAELETILRATREERDTLETAFNNVQGYLKESLATEERLREERGALLKELTQSQIDHRETELLLIEAHRQLTLCEASRDRLRRALDAAMQYVNPKDHAWIDGLAGVSE
jgi:chromosome segregation ATPase